MTQALAWARTAVDSRSARAARRLSEPGRPRLAMLRVTWRQHWAALTVMLTLITIVGTALIISEPYLLHLSRSLARSPDDLVMVFGPKNPDLAMQAIPLLIGMFVGVPLVSRDMTGGTAAFAWTQGYGKTRWVLGKLAAAALILLPAAVTLGLLFGWWFRLYVPAIGYFKLHAFALYAPALTGWTIAGLTLGTAAGVVARTDGRGMAITVLGWVVLHRFVAVGSPGMPGSAFWPLQFAQLGVLVAVSALLVALTTRLVSGAPAVPGMPRLLRSAPWSRELRPERLSQRLAGQPQLAITRAAIRQHRTGLLVAAGLLAGSAVILVVTGLHIHAEPARLRPSFDSLSGRTFSAGRAGPANSNLDLLLLSKFLIGTIIGAWVTAREFERRTATFAWVQGVSRARWMSGKLVSIGLVLALAAVGIGLVFQWFNQPYLVGRLDDPAFGLYAPAFAGWMLASFALGAFMGALTREAVAGVVASLPVSLVAAQVNSFLRAYYLAPATVRADRLPMGTYMVNMYIGRLNGRPLTGRAANRALYMLGHRNTDARLARMHAATFYVIQPGSRFWPFQLIETAGLLALAVTLGAATVWIVRRRET